MRWVIGVSFLAMAVWSLILDELGERKVDAARFGVFGTTLVAFFFVEMGDKTQLATIALAAKYDALAAVVIGTTLGMMIANVPAVLLGSVAADKLPVRLVHGVAAALFALLGIVVSAGLDVGL